MRLLFVQIFFLVLVSGVAKGQVGQSFPEMTCTSLNDQDVSLPNHTLGKYTLIGMAYSKKAEEYLKTWYKPVFYKFIYKPEQQTLFQEEYDVNLFFIPMFTGFQQRSAGQAQNQMKALVDAKLHPYVLLYKGELGEYKDQLAMQDKDLPYFFVLDESGKIVMATSGAYSESKMEQVEEILDDW